MYTHAFYISISKFAPHHSADNQILAEARRNNPNLNLTGCLFRSDRLYAQILEGPEAHVSVMMDTIRLDKRHAMIREWNMSTSETRFFPEWAMGFALNADGDSILTSLKTAKERPIREVADQLRTLFQERFALQA